jgi:hypothetical protein
MAVIHGRLADIQAIPATTGSLYANPVSTKSFVKGFTLFNNNTTAETVKRYNVPDSTGSLGTAALANQFLEISLASLETFIFEFPGDGAVMEDTNDSIQGVTTTDSKVTVQIHGVQDV